MVDDIETRDSPEPVYIICKLVFNVKWSLDFKNKYYIHFYVGSDVQLIVIH